MQRLSDGALARLSADGDDHAFAEIVARHAGAMRRYARYLVRSETEADEAVQEAFITAWSGLSDLKDPTALHSWLMKITARKAIDQVRSRRKTHPLDEEARQVPAAGTSPHDAAEQVDKLDRLRQVLEQLPENQRQTWVLREVGHLSYQEIAEQMQVSAATVRGRLSRARQTIGQEMEEWR